MAQPLSIDFSDPIPLFPLPGCVLLPHATIPLHVFEPRYRTMISDALLGRSLIAMASFEGQKWKSDYQGHPPLRPYVCVGQMAQCHELPDGRYNILLQGICRAKIVHEIGHEPYRKAILEPTEIAPLIENDQSESRQTIEELLKNPPIKNLASVSAMLPWITEELSTDAMVDLAVMSLCDNAEQRYKILAETSPQLRADWIESHLLKIRKTLRLAERFEPPECEDYQSLN